MLPTEFTAGSMRVNMRHKRVNTHNYIIKYVDALKIEYNVHNLHARYFTNHTN